MFSITAINETETSRSQALAPTKEAQECHLTKLYQDALLSMQSGDLVKARNLFQAIIHDPLSIKAQRDATAKNDAMLHLRFLTFRNLAETFVQQGSEFYPDGLQCYIQAVTIDGKDVVLWNRLGTLACSLGLLTIARKAFEQGLHCSPRHWSCMEKLVEVLIAIGDESGCLSVVKRLLKLHPSHSRALHVKNVIEQDLHRHRSIGTDGLGMDSLEPRHNNLTFARKRKISSAPESSKPRKKKQHSVQLILQEPSWSNVMKAVVDSFRNREHGKVLKSEELKDRTSYLANSRIVFTLQGSHVDNAESSQAAKTLEGNSNDAVLGDHLSGKVSPLKLLENEEHPAHERRSTRLERLRSRKLDKCEETVADCPKSLTQLLEPFILDSSHVEVEVEDSKMTEASNRAHSQRVDGCLICSSLDKAANVSHNEAESLVTDEVLHFMKVYTNNSGLYHIGEGILERVSHSSMVWRDYSGLLELERHTRQWGKGRSSTCNLFLAELYVDAASTTIDSNKISQSLNSCSYSICKVVECAALKAQIDRDNNIEVTPGSDAEWHFWARFHWLNGRYCMSSGNSWKGFNEFKKCLTLLQAQQDTCAAVVLPHCKVDNRISVQTIEQKLFEFEVGDLLKNSAVEMQKEGKHSELIEVLLPVLFSDRASKSNVWFSGKCTEALQSHEFNALNMLISACRHVKPVNVAVQLKCHLRKLEILSHCAGILSPRAEEDLLHSPSLSSPSNVELDDEKFKEAKTWTKAIAEEVKLLSRCAAILKEKTDDVNPQVAEASVLVKTQHVLLMVLVHFGSGISSKSRHSNLSLTDQLESSYFVDTAIAFCRIQHLYPAVPFEQQVALLVVVHDLLAEREICSAGASCEDGEGSFLKMAIKHLLALEIRLKQQFTVKPEADSEQTPETGTGRSDNGKVPGRSESFTDLSLNLERTNEELEKKRVELGLDSALDQCFFCLYGLNLKADLESYAGPSDDLAVHKTTVCGDFQTKEQCAAVLQYVLPYAKSCSKTGLAKLRKVLQAVRKQFPQPPSNILAGNVIDTFLDDLEFDEDKFSEMVICRANIEDILDFAFPKQEEEPAAAVVIYSTPPVELQTEDPKTVSESYTEVYQNLYYLLSQVEDMSPVEKSPGFILTKEGEDHVEQSASLYKYDLLYNMLRFEGWQKLASIYDEEVDVLLNDGSKNVNVLEWRKNARLTSRVENSRRRSRRCFLMSLALAGSQAQQFQIHELLALVYYDTLQNLVPSYDQRSLVQKKDNLWLSKCMNASKHFELAYAQRPDWTHLLYLGKLSEKLGKPSEESFSFYKKAIDMNPSAVDPLYRLHRSRLKLLCKGRYHNVEIIRAVMKYCFLSTTEESVKAKLACLQQHDENFEQGTGESQQADIAAAWKLLFKDCMSAMQACVDGELKHFHKARFGIAQGLYLRAEEQDWERAKDELGFCFRSSRSLFTINMWELDGVVKKNRRKATGSTSSKKVLELGLPESSRKFITCVRKYLLLYILLCEKAGDVVTLERAYSTLRIDKRFCICLEDIANVALASYVHALGAAIGQAEKSGSAGPNSLQGLLERMFNLFMDHGVSWADTSDTDGSEVADKSVYCYIHRYLHYLENDCRVDALELVNERIRKRFKNPKLTNPNFTQICRHATLAWCRALCSALSSVTPLERTSDQPTSQLIVDLQYDVLLCSPYDAEIMSKISQVSIAGGLDETGSIIPPASAAYIARIKAVPIVQVSPENAEKAQSYLRATFVFYREVTSGPFPNGINLFTASPASETTGTAIPGFEPLDLSTPRKLLLWAFALVHGRAASMADVVKYCEEQAKTRLKKWPPAAAHPQQPAPPEKLAVVPHKRGEPAASGAMEADVNAHTGKQEPPHE